MSENYAHLRMLRDLGSFNPWVRRFALRKARKLSPANLLLLLRAWNKRYMWAYLLRWFFVLGSAALFFCGLYWWGPALAIHQNLLFYVIPGISVPILSAALPIPAHRGIVDLLRGTQDLIFVDLGLTLLSEPHLESSTFIVRETIVRLLPDVPSRQAARWTDDQRLALLQMLSYEAHISSQPGALQRLRFIAQCILEPQYLRNRITGADVEQGLVVLKFLERAGDDREIPFLQELVERDALTQKEKKIQEAATQSLFCVAHKRRSTPSRPLVSPLAETTQRAG